MLRLATCSYRYWFLDLSSMMVLLSGSASALTRSVSWSIVIIKSLICSRAVVATSSQLNLYSSIDGPVISHFSSDLRFFIRLRLDLTLEFDDLRHRILLLCCDWFFHSIRTTLFCNVDKIRTWVSAGRDWSKGLVCGCEK